MNSNYFVATKQCDCNFRCYNVPEAFRIPEASLSGRFYKVLINRTDSLRLENTAESKSFGSRLSTVAIRCLAAIAAFFCAVADLLWCVGKTIVVFPVVKKGYQEHFAEFPSAISQFALSWTLIAGYAPAAHVKKFDRFPPRPPLNLHPTPAELQTLRAQLTQKEKDKLDESLRENACEVNSSELLVSLIQKGADPNAADENGRTALMCAAAYRREQNVKVLLNYSANPNVETKYEGSEKVTALEFFLLGVGVDRLSFPVVIPPNELRRSAASIALNFLQAGARCDIAYLTGIEQYINALLRKDAQKFESLIKEDAAANSTSPCKQVLTHLFKTLRWKFFIKQDSRYANNVIKPFAENFKICLEELIKLMPVV